MCFTLSHFIKHKLLRCPVVSDAKTDLGQAVVASIRDFFFFFFLKRINNSMSICC